jgi:hypothetical protein
MFMLMLLVHVVILIYTIPYRLYPTSLPPLMALPNNTYPEERKKERKKEKTSSIFLYIFALLSLISILAPSRHHIIPTSRSSPLPRPGWRTSLPSSCCMYITLPSRPRLSARWPSIAIGTYGIKLAGLWPLIRAQIFPRATSACIIPARAILGPGVSATSPRAKMLPLWAGPGLPPVDTGDEEAAS